jgi:hypothetical protein
MDDLVEVKKWYQNPTIIKIGIIGLIVVISVVITLITGRQLSLEFLKQVIDFLNQSCNSVGV